MIIFIVIWFLSGFIPTVGFYHAHTKAKFPRLYDWREELGFAIVLGILYGVSGPIGFLLSYSISGFAKHGWSLK